MIMRKSNFKTSPRLRRTLVTLLCILAFIHPAGAQSLVTFDNTSDLTTYFTEGLPATLPMTNRSDLGLGNSACINVQSNSFDIWTTKAGYSVSGAGDVYVLSAYFKNRGSGGYGALGFSTTVDNTINNYGAPLKGLGMSFHGGGGYFENNRVQTPVSWAGGDMSTGTNSTWYKMILTVTAKGSNTYDLNFQIWNSDTNGVLSTKKDEKVLNGVVNADIGAASILHVYFAAAGDRMEKIDNFSINLSGGATIIDAGKPVVVTNAVSSITANTASCGGNVTDEQGAAVSAKGVCWSTTAGPTIADSKSTDGTGTGSFTSSIAGLTPATTYYVRAYATNSNGTSYGSEVTFTTMAGPMTAPGNALNFDGTSDYVNLVGTFGNWASATIEAQFINDGATGDFQAILSASELAFVHLQVKEVDSGNIAVYTDAGALNLPLPNLATDHKWKHIAISIKSGDSRLYINGEQYGAANTMVFTKILPSSTVCIGRGFQNGRYFKGSIDEVRVWSVARSQADIKSTMNTQLAGTETGLEAYYNFNAGVSCSVNTTVTSLIDLTPNNHTGTLNTFDLSTADCTSNWIQSYAMVYPVATAATSIISTGFTANWQAPSNGIIDKYKLDVSKVSDFSTFVLQGQDVSSGTSFSVTSLTANTQYYYRVRAVNNSIGDIGGYSNVISVTTLENAPTLTTTTGSGKLDIGSSGGAVIDAGITINSLDPNTLINNGLVYISNNLKSTEDAILYPAAKYGVTASYNSATGVLLLSGSATVAQYQEIFRTIEYQNTNASATVSDRTFTFSLGNALPFTPCGASTAHYYEFIPNSGITWTAAKTAAEARTYFGLQGYLTTITCAEENNFASKSIAKKGWIGASDAAAEGDWKWVTGPEAGTSFYTGNGGSGGHAVGTMYNNWSIGEPNNSGGNENYAHYLNSSYWNDYANTTPVDGYYVEYGGMSGDPTIAISASKVVKIVPAVPTLTTSTGTVSRISGNTTAVVIDPNVTVNSITAGATLDNGLVYINSGFVSSEDKIIYPANLYGVTATYTAATGVLQLSGTATMAQYQEIFRTIQYQNTNTVAAAGSRSFTFALGNALPYTPCGATSSHYYEFVPVNLSWTAAKAAAEARSYFGLQGYLTTITCAEENNFAYQSIGKKGWIGASDAAVEGDWRWVTGPEAGTTLSSHYTNWYPGEPNNSGGSENYAHFYNGGKWNDWPENNTVDGYYVEYGGMPSDPASISISGVKALTIILAAPSAAAAQAVCGSGTVADLVATPPTGSSVRWYTVPTAGTALTSTTALITATTYYAESSNGSSASPTRTAVVLTINALPTQPVLVPTSTAKVKVKLCPGDNIVCSNFDNTLSYQWKLNGSNLTGQTSNQYKVPVGGAGVYSLYVKNLTTGCDNLSATVNVDLYSITTPVIYEKKKSDYISILIVDNTSKFYTGYSWSYADGSALPSGIVNDRQFLVLPPANMAASYMVNITDTNACKVTSAVKTVVLHTIAAKAYPTMNNGNFMVGLSDAQDGKLNVKIFNQNGILQKVYAFDNVSSEFEYQVNAAGLQAGAYTVEISLGDYVQSQKIIIR